VARNECGPTEFDFSAECTAGLVVCAGGFEQRSIAFASRLGKPRFSVERGLILQYENPPTEENEANYKLAKKSLRLSCRREPETLQVNENRSVQGSQKLQSRISELCSRLESRTALIDISGMTHLLAVSSLHACLTCGLRTYVIYTEARSYFPSKTVWKKVVRAWRTRDYDNSRKFLQSAGLKAVYILPEFSGNFRSGHQTCLVVLAGHEPNRVEGLVDDYAPGALIVLYGVSPHQPLKWRTQLSRELHSQLFSQWHVRESEVSTLKVNEVLDTLEQEFRAIRDQYDVAIASQCSKMQAVATYLFWRRHPEVQLVFTSPVSFNPKRYSLGVGRTFMYEIP
jgi:hypothetical protein